MKSIYRKTALLLVLGGAFATAPTLVLGNEQGLANTAATQPRLER